MMISEQKVSSTTNPSQPIDAPNHNWFDWLLTFFGPNRQTGQRMIVFLLNNAFTHSHYYWFDMWHMPTIRRAGNSEDARINVHPSLVFGMVAIGLRQRQSRRRTYGMGIGETLISDEVIPPARNDSDLSERIKDAANVFLEQDIISTNRNTNSWLDTAKAALMLMQLERELSPRYLYLLGIARSIMLNSNLHQALKVESDKSTNNRYQNSPLQKPISKGDPCRSNVQIEEAARLALLPIWAGTRIGMAYFNVETHQTGFSPEDLVESYVFAPWSDGSPEESQKNTRGPGESSPTARWENKTNDVGARILGLNVMYTNYRARYLPYGLDYNKPTSELTSILRAVDDMEFIYSLMVEEVDWLEQSFFRLLMMRFTTSLCHLHGILIRRLGHAHCDSLRNQIVTNSTTNNETAGIKDNLTFESPVLRGWCRVQQIYMTEIDLDYMSADGQGHLLQVTKFQCDVIRLYWLGTKHFHKGVKEALRLAGLDHRKDELAQMLYTTAQELGLRIRRHDAATTTTTTTMNLVRQEAVRA